MKHAVQTKQRCNHICNDKSNFEAQPLGVKMDSSNTVGLNCFACCCGSVGETGLSSMCEAKPFGATLVAAPVSTKMPHVFEALLKGWKFFSIATVKTGAECTG